jgi:AraC-like DNA-binding protein/quercetin dioxygenase-like cupin family protein
MPKTCTFLPPGIKFEPFLITHMVDQKGRYHVDLDPAFPMVIKAYTFDPREAKYPLNWHERLEIFAVVSGSGSFQMGERILDYSAGDVLVVDNNRLHGLKSVSGDRPSALSISFSPELVYNSGSPTSDFEYLAMFYGQGEGHWPAVREPAVHDALRRLLTNYFRCGDDPWFRTGCKAYLLEVLHQLGRCIQQEGPLRAQAEQQRQQSKRLGRLFDHLQAKYTTDIRVADAARLIGMSESRFMRFFKQATGLTFVSYLGDLRLRMASRLLSETTDSISEIAAAAGFSDQSYFDRRFKLKFGRSPRDYRTRHKQGQ